MSQKEGKTISERYKLAVSKYYSIIVNGEISARKTSETYQDQLLDLIKEFKLVRNITEELSLFSDNEILDEINTAYIPFLNLDYYLGNLYSECLKNPKNEKEQDAVEFKEANLSIAKRYLVRFLVRLDSLEKILDKDQSLRVQSFNETYNPTDEELVTSKDPARKRAEKIANYKREKELLEKFAVLDEYYEKYKNRGVGETLEFDNFDDETIKAVYIDQLIFFSLKSFNLLELIVFEMQVLKNRPTQRPIQNSTLDDRAEDKKVDDYGFTTKLESVVRPDQMKVSDLLSKQGKILRPFTITSDKQTLKQKVFGTGQVLPSMSVEEYLDYELAHGKMAQPEEAAKGDLSDDSEDELEKRRWDDWKDEHPKGMGNTKSNIG